jgi:uncharacterized protein YggT (Ycf19 family)
MIHSIIDYITIAVLITVISHYIEYLEFKINNNFFVKIIDGSKQISEPFLFFLRNYALSFGFIDFTPMILIFALQFLKNII